MGAMAELMAERLTWDEDGFLQDVNAWKVGFVDEFASGEGIRELTSAHWKVIAAIRFHYEKYGISPLCRDILSETGLSKDDLYNLFPRGHRSAYKLAGLPKPPEC